VGLVGVRSRCGLVGGPGDLRGGQLGIARAGAADAGAIMQEVAAQSALDLAAGDVAAERVQALAHRLTADLRLRAEAELARLEAFGGPVPIGPVRTTSENSAAVQTVPRRALDGVPPGVVGLTYDEMAALVDAMAADDPGVNWETLRIFGDELWNFADGRRTIAEIAEAVCYEFGFQVRADHFLALARGLEKAGHFILEAPR
jgi:hypothetical protein